MGDHPSLIPLLAGVLMALALAACGVEQAQPAPPVDNDRWGHLPPDPQEPQQADSAAAGTVAAG